MRMPRSEMTLCLASTLLLAGCAVRIGEGAPEPEPEPVTARNQPGTGMGLYEPEQHELYDGRFVIVGSDVHQVGRLDDESPWDHMGDDASNVAPVGGDSNWPKSLLYVAGWGYGRGTLDGEELYSDYQIHFMVTQGMRDRETLQVRLEPAEGPAGSVNPAAQQLDFYIRSPENNDANHPNREVFDHFFAMAVTWK